MNKCYYCGKTLYRHRLAAGEIGMVGEAPETRDHIIPSAHGGINDPRNYVAACSRCNKTKADYSLEQFAQMLDAGFWSHIGRAERQVMADSTRRLIERIAPYRAELYRKDAPAVYPIEPPMVSNFHEDKSNVMQFNGILEAYFPKWEAKQKPDKLFRWTKVNGPENVIQMVEKSFADMNSNERAIAFTLAVIADLDRFL